MRGVFLGAIVVGLLFGAAVAGVRAFTRDSDEADAPAGAIRKRPLGPSERVTFDALTAAIADRAEEPPPADGIPRGVRGASVTQWHATALRYLPQPETKQKNQAFDRAIASLTASGLVRHVADFAWLP